MTLYIQNSILRESCYNCRYKGKNNFADIILGDYWGIGEIHPELFDEQGLSAIIINSKKGKEYIEKQHILKNTIYVESNIESIEKYNSAYNESPQKTYRRYTLKQDIKNNTLNLIAEADRNKQLLKEKDDNNIDTRIAYLEKEIKNIRNSKRWRITDKLFNIINKILRRG